MSPYDIVPSEIRLCLMAAPVHGSSVLQSTKFRKWHHHYILYSRTRPRWHHHYILYSRTRPRWPGVACVILQGPGVVWSNIKGARGGPASGPVIWSVRSLVFGFQGCNKSWKSWTWFHVTGTHPSLSLISHWHFQTVRVTVALALRLFERQCSGCAMIQVEPGLRSYPSHRAWGSDCNRRGTGTAGQGSNVATSESADSVAGGVSLQCVRRGVFVLEELPAALFSAQESL